MPPERSTREGRRPDGIAGPGLLLGPSSPTRWSACRPALGVLSRVGDRRQSSTACSSAWRSWDSKNGVEDPNIRVIPGQQARALPNFMPFAQEPGNYDESTIPLRGRREGRTWMF
jgi:hypothetical protein